MACNVLGCREIYLAACPVVSPSCSITHIYTHPTHLGQAPRHEWQGFLRSPRWFCGNLWVPPTTALLQRRTTLEALLSGYPPVGLLDAKNVYHAEQKAIALPRPERRGLRSPWGQPGRRIVRISKVLNADGLG